MRSTNPTSVLCRPPCSLKNINYLHNEGSDHKGDIYLFSFANEFSRNHSSKLHLGLWLDLFCSRTRYSFLSQFQSSLCSCHLKSLASFVILTTTRRRRGELGLKESLEEDLLNRVQDRLLFAITFQTLSFVAWSAHHVMLVTPFER